MSSKVFDLPGIGKVSVSKRRRNRNIRLSFDSRGGLRVSIPPYAPYRAGLAFVKSKQKWIAKHHPKPPKLLTSGQIVANAYRLEFKPSQSAKTASARILNQTVRVTYPKSLEISSEPVQAAARRGTLKAIKLEAEQILPLRLAELAKIHNYKYKSLQIKPMKTRWGSCDSRQNITLNCYLVTLAPELIDYVILHELTHTRHQHHQPTFWRTMEQVLPQAKSLRRRARATQPGL